MDLGKATLETQGPGRIRRRFLAGLAWELREEGLHPADVARLIHHARWRAVDRLDLGREVEHDLNRR
ncbi:MAG: hypothetical protein ACP5G2_06705 [Candidatus Bipolaricaulaceae bacterium]